MDPSMPGGHKAAMSTHQEPSLVRLESRMASKGASPRKEGPVSVIELPISMAEPIANDEWSPHPSNLGERDGWRVIDGD